jgi:CubicO group peptidase (beta-lactamase class C family)
MTVAGSAAAIDDLLAPFTARGGPGLVCAVAHDGRLVYARAAGLADCARAAPLAVGSVFYVGSLAKQFTAACIALLALEGALSLDDPLTTYLPELAGLGPIRLRHLVHHTSGVRDYFDLMTLRGWRRSDYLNNQMIVDLLARQRSANFAPGARRLYSNSNYILLAEIVRAVAGRSLREFAQARLFAPLAMNQTRYADDVREPIPGRVTGYARGAGGAYEPLHERFEMHGDGGLYSTVEDLLRWDANFYSGAIGGRAFLDTMLTRGVLGDGETIPYAFGLGRFVYRGLSADSHSGAMNGFRAELMRFPEAHLSVAVLANDADVDPTAMAHAIADLLLEARFPEPRPPELEPSELRPSEYRPSEYRPSRLRPSESGPSESRPREPGPPGPGRPQAASIGAGAAGPARVGGDASPPRPYDGLYECAELGVRYRVETTAEALTLHGPMDATFASAREDVFEGAFGALTFARASGGAVAGFALSTARALDIRFSRLARRTAGPPV